MGNDKLDRERTFRELLVRIKKSPLYGQKLADYDLDGVSLDGLRTLPLTSKAELRKAGAFGYLAVDRRQVAQYHESFGTTGAPAASWFTARDLENGGAQMGQCGAALTAEDFVLIRFPYALSVPAFLMQQACRQAGAAVVPASSRNTVTPYPRVLELLKRLGVTVMAGLPREMELLAETARLMGVDARKDFPSLRAICVAGELLGERRKEHIERLWNVPVYNLFGSTETANIAAMCEYGVLHIAEEDFVVEVLREDGSGPAAPGERGLAAITTLSHEASPLLRYFNEDVISVEPAGCPCGRDGGKLVHYGRLKDRTAFGAITLDAVDVQDAVYSLEPVPDAWKAIQQENGFHFILDSHRHGQWSEEGLRTKLSGLLHVPVTAEIASGETLLNREELRRDVPSRKPAYIYKPESEAPQAGSVILLRDLMERGCRKFRNGRYEEAKELFVEACETDTRSAEAHAWLAAAYGRLIEAAWSMMDKIKLLPMLESEVAAALDIDPALPLARRMNGARLLNTPDMLGGDPEAAIDEFVYCISQGMDEAEVWAALADCYLKTGDPRKAAEALKEALARDPEDAKANELMRQAEAAAGKEDGKGENARE